MATTDRRPGTSRAKRMERKPEAARPSSTRRPSCWSKQSPIHIHTAILCWIPPPLKEPPPLPTSFSPPPPGFFLPSSPTRLQGCCLLWSGPTSQISPTAAVRGWSSRARFAPSFSSALSSFGSDKSTTTFCTSFSPGTLTAATQKHKSGDIKVPSEKPPPTLQYVLPRWLSSKESTCNAGDARDKGSIPGWGRSPGGGNGNLLQYSCLGNPMDRGAWTVHGVAKSWTRLSN